MFETFKNTQPPCVFVQRWFKPKYKKANTWLKKRCELFPYEIHDLPEAADFDMLKNNSARCHPPLRVPACRASATRHVFCFTRCPLPHIEQIKSSSWTEKHSCTGTEDRARVWAILPSWGCWPSSHSPSSTHTHAQRQTHTYTLPTQHCHLACWEIRATWDSAKYMMLADNSGISTDCKEMNKDYTST